MGLSKFLAGRIQQMRSGKSYLATHPSSFNCELPSTCPRYRAAPETFEHAILHSKSHSHQKELHLPGLDSLDADSPVWSSNHLVASLGRFIIATSTSFPPDMLPQSPHDSPSFVTHRVPERMRESSYPTLAHEPPEKSDTTSPSSPGVGTRGHEPSPGKLRPLTQIRDQENPTYNTVYVAAVRPTGSCSQDI